MARSFEGCPQRIVEGSLGAVEIWELCDHCIRTEAGLGLAVNESGVTW